MRVHHQMPVNPQDWRECAVWWRSQGEFEAANRCEIRADMMERHGFYFPLKGYDSRKENETR